MNFHDQLQQLSACDEAVTWVGKKSLRQAWATCERADWLLWLCAEYIGRKGWPTRQEIVLAACDCAMTVKHLWPKDDDRPAKAIKIARTWAHGKASLKKVRAAATAAYAAVATATYVDAAAYVAAATAAYAAAAADAHVAAYVTTAAATATYAAADAAAYVEKHEAHIKMCRLIRKRLHPRGTV